MKTNKILFAFLIAIFAAVSLAQVKVTSETVTYQRKGADVSEYKKSFDVTYPKFSGVGDQDRLKRLESIFSYWRVFDTDLKQETDNQWLESLNYEVKYNKNGVLVIEMWMYGSGAYPDQSSRTVIASTDSGTPIRFKDTFQNRIGLLTELDKAQDAEMKAAVQRMKEEQTEDAEDIFDNVPRASDEVEEFSVSDAGVTFLFDYGFPHVIQALQPEGRFFFSWSEIKPFLREYSTVDMIAQKALVPGATAIIFDTKTSGVLGGVKNGDFLDVMAAAREFKAERSFAVIGPGEKSTGLTINNYTSNYVVKVAAEQPDDICPDFRYGEILPKVEMGVGISKDANWNPIPRDATKLDTNNAVYLKAVSDFLRTKKLPLSKPKIEALYKVDLDGDGVDEVVIQATNYMKKEYTVEKGGYSFVMVRKVVNGKAVDLLLGGDFIVDADVGAESTYEINGIIDLNGDGNMEVVVFSSYYEGASVAAFKIVNDAAIEVLETGCGL